MGKWIGLGGKGRGRGRVVVTIEGIGKDETIIVAAVVATTTTAGCASGHTSHQLRAI